MIPTESQFLFFESIATLSDITWLNLSLILCISCVVNVWSIPWWSDWLVSVCLTDNRLSSWVILISVSLWPVGYCATCFQLSGDFPWLIFMWGRILLLTSLPSAAADPNMDLNPPLCMYGCVSSCRMLRSQSAGSSSTRCMFHRAAAAAWI